MSDKSLMASESMVSKISKILNQAERAPEGSPEREAFMERAMKLSQAYSIDLAVARAATAKKERVEVPERRSFQVGQPGLSKNKNAHFVDLMLAICHVYDIQVTISSSNTYVHGTGMPSDLDLAERLYSMLTPQMLQGADAGLKRGDNGEWLDGQPKMKRVEIPEDERAWGEHDGSTEYSAAYYYDERDEDISDFGGKPQRRREIYRGGEYWGMDWVASYPPPRFKNVPVLDDDGEPVLERKFVSHTDGRVWRVNFYQGFVNRARYRLRDAKKEALKDAGIDLKDEESSGAIALRDKAKEVRDVFDNDPRTVLATGTYGGASVSSYSSTGQLSGDEAGKRAILGNEKVVD